MREKSIDVAKGLAIIAIVLGHVLRGLVSIDVIDGDGEAFQTADRVIYMAHLSVFALLSGLFVQAGLTKYGQADYLRRRVGMFLYLYVLWSLLQGLAGLILAPEGQTLGDVLSLWRPDSQMWFFLWLVVVTVAVAVLKPWGSPVRIAVVMAIALAVSLSRWGIFGSIGGTQGLGLVVFFFAGAALGADTYSRLVTKSVAVSVALAVAAGAVYVGLTVGLDATPPSSGGGTRTEVTIALGLIASTAAVVSIAYISKLLSMTALSRPLEFLGRRSMEIFLAHVFAINAVRVVLNKAGVDSPAIHIVLGTIAGVALPLLLWWVVTRFRNPFIFSAPAFITGESSRGSIPLPRPLSLPDRPSLARTGKALQ
ncbi:acyltransferase [Rhodococcus sp. KBS0724]|uniref:acyltransferase family protein n=1 Tax=Rhodococcus sp. KBS0724 TaxID=1179674 RepID=UPI00110E98C8|nr:acyltransferase [Rhodococcus sp. KBS0724]TSD48939.1 acyltransferase [Rhodococcus sp. KBS0724]